MVIPTNELIRYFCLNIFYFENTWKLIDANDNYQLHNFFLSKDLLIILNKFSNAGYHSKFARKYGEIFSSKR